MTLKTQPQYGFEDYLAAERTGCDVKHEYVNGEVFAMTGASFNHNLIVLNLGSELRAGLKGRPCHVLPSDMRVRIESANAGKYPDLVALCEAPRFHDDRQDVLLNRLRSRRQIRDLPPTAEPRRLCPGQSAQAPGRSLYPPARWPLDPERDRGSGCGRGVRLSRVPGRDAGDLR